MADLDALLDKPLDGLDLAHCHQVQIVAAVGRHHLRSEDAGGTVQWREGLVELGHVAAYRRFFLDKNNALSCLGEVEGRLNSGDSAPDHQRPLGGLRFDLLVPLYTGIEDGFQVFDFSFAHSVLFYGDAYTSKSIFTSSEVGTAWQLKTKSCSSSSCSNA